ncbi:hypothetical protein BRD00_13260 [Halobacteriales archaeon QS_8_69_26]|nr:MAG: hypothetical protein BRD00_13260 [Halobacteriales archaeon QS_8_69_26]
MGGSQRDDRGPMAAPDYCPNCGNELGDPGVYCSQCGHRCRDDGEHRSDSRSGQSERSSSGDPVDESPEAFTRRVEEWLVEGWEVESDQGDSVVLVDRNLGTVPGHALVFLLTVWFTGGLGNLAYAFYKHQFDQEKVLLRRGGGGNAHSTPGRRMRSQSSTGSAILGVGLILLGLLFVASGPLDVTGVLLGAFLLFAGGAIFPPIRRRLRERRPVSNWGRVRSTEERVIHDPNRACTVCAEPVESGVERRYHEEFLAAGIPLFTTEEGSNPYCRECAASDSPRVGEPTDPGDIDAELASLKEDEAADEEDRGGDPSTSGGADDTSETADVSPDDATSDGTKEVDISSE